MARSPSAFAEVSAFSPARTISAGGKVLAVSLWGAEKRVSDIQPVFDRQSEIRFRLEIGCEIANADCQLPVLVLVKETSLTLRGWDMNTLGRYQVEKHVASRADLCGSCSIMYMGTS